MWKMKAEKKKRMMERERERERKREQTANSLIHFFYKRIVLPKERNAKNSSKSNLNIVSYRRNCSANFCVLQMEHNLWVTTI